MVRKLKSSINKVSEIKSKLEEELDLDFMFEENEGETFDRFEKFDVNIPLKSDLFKIKKSGQGNKIEKLTERFGIRITELEKEILDTLKKEGVNVSEKIRKVILKQYESLVKSKIKDKYIDCTNKLEGNLILMENLKTSYLEIKTLRGDTKEEAQELVNRRYKIKYELDSLLRESKHLEDFLNKYNEMFK